VAAPSYRVLALDDVEAVPGPASLAWRPLRAELGLRAFGLSGFAAAGAGDDVIEPHRESGGRGHQELYVVVRGAARFTLDGETFDAPAGLAELPDSPGLMYVQALVAAAERRPEQARGWLAEAVAREPLLLDEARGEDLLADLAGKLAP